MEKSSLGELKFILSEDIFLLEEDLNDLNYSAEEKRNSSSSINDNQVAEPTGPEIIDQKTEPEETEIQELDPIRVRGQFEKGILILHEESSLADPVMDMLVKMIQAVNHSMSEVGLLSSEELEGRSLEEFHELNSHIVLKFGRIKHPINALPIHNYQIHTEDETEYLFADSLSQISENPDLKRKLWNSLKTLFNIT